jgi:hypothetical protein
MANPLQQEEEEEEIWSTLHPTVCFAANAVQQQMPCSSKILDCSRTQNPSWTLKLSLILGHRLSRAICTHDHGEPSEQRFSSVIIIAQNPSTQNVFCLCKKQIPRGFFLTACFASLCLQLAHCYLFLAVFSSWVFLFFWEWGMFLFLEIFFFVAKVGPHSDCWSSCCCCVGLLRAAFCAE